MWARGPLRGRAGLTCTERSFQQEHRVSTEGSFQTGAAQAEPGSDVAEAGEWQPPVLGVRPLPLVGGPSWRRPSASRTAHGLHWGARHRQAVPTEADGLLQEAGPRSASTTPGVWASTHKPAAETSGDVHVWTGRGVTKGLSVLFARSCGLCPRVLV